MADGATFNHKGIEITLGADGKFSATTAAGKIKAASLDALKKRLDKPSEFAPFKAFLIAGWSEKRLSELTVTGVLKGPWALWQRLLPNRQGYAKPCVPRYAGEPRSRECLHRTACPACRSSEATRGRARKVEGSTRRGSAGRQVPSLHPPRLTGRIGEHMNAPHTHLLVSQDTGRVIARVSVPADTPPDRTEFVARNLACQQGVRGVQWLNVRRAVAGSNKPRAYAEREGCAYVMPDEERLCPKCGHRHTAAISRATQPTKGAE